MAVGCGSYVNEACPSDQRASEVILAEMFKKDLGVDINPQALRMFVRLRFDSLSKLSHRIHEGKT